MGDAGLCPVCDCVKRLSSREGSGEISHKLKQPAGPMFNSSTVAQNLPQNIPSNRRGPCSSPPPWRKICPKMEGGGGNACIEVSRWRLLPRAGVNEATRAVDRALEH